MATGSQVQIPSETVDELWCLADEVVPKTVEDYTAGAVGAILESGDAAKTQGRQYGFAIAAGLLRKRLHNPIHETAIRAQILQGKPSPFQDPELDVFNELVDLHLDRLVKKWHLSIFVAAKKLKDEEERTTIGHETLIAEQRKFRDNAVAINEKLEQKAKTAEELMHNAKNFDHEADYKRLRNRAYLLIELSQSWAVILLCAVTALGFGWYIGLNSIGLCKGPVHQICQNSKS